MPILYMHSVYATVMSCGGGVIERRKLLSVPHPHRTHFLFRFGRLIYLMFFSGFISAFGDLDVTVALVREAVRACS